MPWNKVQLVTITLLPLPATAPLQVLSAKVARSEGGGVVHHLKLLLSHGTMPDSTYEARRWLSCSACVAKRCENGERRDALPRAVCLCCCMPCPRPRAFGSASLLRH